MLLDIKNILKNSLYSGEQLKTDNLIKKLQEKGYQKKEIIWKAYHNNDNSAIDPFGNLIQKDDFPAAYILPKIHGGSNNIKNFIPLSLKSISKKRNDLVGTINKKSFEVRKYADGIGTLYVDGKKVSK